MLTEAFTRADPKSAKRKSSHHCLFVLLGSSLIKAARKMLVKMKPDDDPQRKAGQLRRER